MNIAEIDVDYASTALSQKLQEAGFSVLKDTSNENGLRVEWEAEQGETLSGVIVTFIFSDWLYEFIVRRLHNLHPYLTDDEAEYISLLAFHSMRKDELLISDTSPSEWKSRVDEAVARVTRGGAPIDVGGIMRFRAKDYLLGIDEAVNEMVEQFLTDREYEEFVSMLRYMLDAQEETTQVLHVFCTDDMVWICDAEGELVRDREVTQAARQVSEGDDVNSEDLAMSILITRSPCRIVIHDMTTCAPWPSFPETCERVFLNRAQRCGECSTCVQLTVCREQTLFESTMERPAYPGHD